MDVKIGIAQSAQVIEVDVDDGADRNDLKDRIAEALAASTEDSAHVLWLTDRKGREVAVASSRITFVEIGSADLDRRIGFGA